jgi:hypothetical protein
MKTNTSKAIASIVICAGTLFAQPAARAVSQTAPTPPVLFGTGSESLSRTDIDALQSFCQTEARLGSLSVSMAPLLMATYLLMSI